MKRFSFALVAVAALLLTSCYSHTFTVGDGPQKRGEVTEWNHYLIFGLAPVSTCDPDEMTDGAEDYEIHTRHTFVNGLVSALTFGIYSPTTTTVKY